MNVAENFEEILSAFTKQGVDFLLTGGYAVNFYGYNRSTSDLDIWVNPVESNKIPIHSALLSLNFSKEDLEQLLELDFTKPFSFALGADPIDIDVFNAITGIQYSEAYKNKIPYRFSEKLTINYVSLKDLVLNKMLTGRPKDKIDVDELQKIQKLKKEK